MRTLVNARDAARLARRSKSQINRDANAGKLPVAVQYPGYNGPRLFDPEIVAAVYHIDQHESAAS